MWVRGGRGVKGCRVYFLIGPLGRRCPSRGSIEEVILKGLRRDSRKGTMIIVLGPRVPGIGALNPLTV